MFSFAQDSLSDPRIISLTLFKDPISPTQIVSTGKGTFILLDTQSREMVLLNDQGIIHRSGGFGQTAESLSDPVDMVGENLNLWVCDRSENIIHQFDYSLNYIGLFRVNEIQYDPFYTDIIIKNPFGKPYIFSRIYGELWSVSGSVWPLIDLNQFGINGECIIDISSESSGNIAFLSCDNLVLVFNRYGRLMNRLTVEIPDPTLVLSVKSHWIVINESGVFQQLNNDNVSKIDLLNKEIIIDVDTNGQDLFLLTSERILIY